ncbi:MAG: DNA polymerase III subunit delta [Candidatus Adiutrix sp.]|jgi:DNA polymerase III delta subunit|nr:DNA polymerase III subunit delta [Candidatus Adiutrix sp.]
MTPAAFIKEIAGSGRRPLYVLSGGDPTAVARCLAAALDSVAPDFRDLNCQTLNLEAGQAARLIGGAQTLPFGPPPRVMTVKNPPFAAEDWNALADYLESPNPDTVILLALEDKLDERLRFSKKIKAAGLEVDCRPLKGEALVKWLAEELKTRGLSADRQVCALIIELAGDDPRLLAGEAEKLSLYLEPGQKLSAELIRNLVRPVLDAQLYHLADHLGRGRLREALSDLLEILSDSHREKDKKVQDSDRSMLVLAALENRFLAFLNERARPAGAEDWPTPRFMAKLNPITRKIIQEQLGRWPWPALARALAALEEAHLARVSSGDHPPRILLENLVLTLAALGRSGR